MDIEKLIQACLEESEEIDASLSRNFDRVSQRLEKHVADAIMSGRFTIPVEVTREVHLSHMDLQSKGCYKDFVQQLKERKIEVARVDLNEKTFPLGGKERTVTDHIHFTIKPDMDVWKDILFAMHKGNTDFLKPVEPQTAADEACQPADEPTL